MIRNLNKYEYTEWLKLAAEVEDLFGPMVDSEEFQTAIRECIENKNAFCVADDGIIKGIIAIDRVNNEISWLAVSRKFRGNNTGRQLVEKAIQELDPNRNIFVQTFASGIEAGKTARYIYEKNGFTDYKDAGRNPAGIETTFMVRKYNLS